MPASGSQRNTSAATRNGPRAAPPDTKVKQLSFAFPFLKKGQRDKDTAIKFTDEHEIYQLLADKEPGGSFLVSKNAFWHGGIHITENGAGTRLDLKQGIRCIADGHVIAYRVNRTYPVSQFGDAQVPYSTGFALVRHTMEFPKGNTLTFYSLYMHLQAYDEYERDTTKAKPVFWATRQKITEHAQDKPDASRTGQLPNAGEQGLRVRSAPKAGHSGGRPVGILPQGACVSIGEIQKGWGKITDVHDAQPFASKVGDAPPATVVGGWIFLGNEHGGPVVQDIMPDDAFDRVVVTLSSGGAHDAHAQGIPVKAGDLMGHLGRYDSLNASPPSATRMAHIEVFCDESVKSFIEQSRAWVVSHGAHREDWTPLGLSSEPTLLRIGEGTTLYRNAEQQGAEAPVTGVVQRWSLSELARDKSRQRTETAADRSGRKVNWWHVGSVDQRGQSIEGWVREESFAGGMVTREFAQKWVDFDWLDGAHDPAHTIFATTRSWVDFSKRAEVPDAKSQTRLSPIMQAVYRKLFPHGDGAQAADDLCLSYASESGHYPWLMQTASRLIVKHESEWANPEKWKQLYTEMDDGATDPQWEEEQKRIEKLVWWDEVKAKVSGFPESDVFHIHPIGVVGNFIGGSCSCEGRDISVETLQRIATAASEEKIRAYISSLNQAFSDFNLTTCITRAHFIAQLLTESGQFQFTVELADKKLDYDPWRGRGLIQITFQKNYEKYGRYVNEDFTSNAAAMSKLERAPHAMLSAAWYYAVEAALIEHGDRDDFIWISRSINGGFNGYDHRRTFINRAIEVLGLKSCAKLNKNGVYDFEESRAYGEKRAAFAWGLWNDPGKSKSGITNKTATEAIKGYARYIELDNLAGKPKDSHGKPVDRKWYGIGSDVCVRDVAEERLRALSAT
ncbi:hypothetical protein CR51_28805 [Caballeronia megalochromosomata]|nr:hypothetical protein CR51_28805 [Caballeronia megalochromosomata]